MNNISRAVGVFGLGATDIVALPEAEPAPVPAVQVAPARSVPERGPDQDIYFCTTGDGVQLAIRAWATARCS